MASYRTPHDRANAVNTSNASVTLLGAPGVGKRYQILRLEMATKTADDLTIKSGATVIDTWYMSAPTNGVKDYDDKWLELGVNEALVVDKGTAATNLSWVVYYRTVSV